jgi:uncharacterized repeat protein (TIGR01451 family)
VESSPAIGGDGTIYVGSADNNLYAIGGPPALQVIKTGPAEARHGDQVTYKIEVCNIGGTPAVSTTLTDILPNGLYYVSSNPSGTHDHGIVTWELGEIAPTNCRSVYLTATVDCSLPDQAIVYDTASVVWKDPCQNEYGPSTNKARTRVKKQYIKKPPTEQPKPSAERPKPSAERPARFLITYPHIVPTRVLPNQPVNVLLNVKNVAASGGYYTAVLYIDGEVEYSQTVYISPGQTQRLVFTVYRETPGKYWAAVDGYGAWFTVAEAAEVAEYEVVTSPPPPSGGLGTPALLAIILGSIGVGVAIFFATRPRVT